MGKTYREVQFVDVSIEKQLNKNIIVAPLHQSYALCIEYMKHWFLSKFDSGFFSWTHLDGSHVFGDMTKYTRKEMMSHKNEDKASLTIIPSIDDEYNRDRLDQNLFGIDQFIKKVSLDNSFFKDPVNHRYIMMKTHMILMNFTFKLKLPSRAMQLDVQEYMKLAFRTNLSESAEIDLDYLLPYPMMLFMAKDLGFEITEDEQIKNPIQFLTYLNSRSFLPIMYKRSNVNGREEYFVRLSNLPVRLLIKDVNKDDGNRYGHLSDDFTIEMQVETRMPAMHFYVYYSKYDFRGVKFGKEVYNIDNTLMMSLHYYDDPPSVNDRGWSLAINSQWEEEKPHDIKIDLNELFNYGELAEICQYLVGKYISPNVFLDIQLYNNGSKLTNVVIDWDKMQLTATNPSESLVTTIAIYINLEYLNTIKVDLRGNHATKVMMSDPRR